MKRPVGKLLLLAIIGACNAQSEEAVRVSICDLLADPVAWNGKMIEVRAQVIDSNNFWIMGTECPTRIHAKGTVFIAGFVFGDPQSKNTNAHKVDFRWDLSNLDRLNAALARVKETKEQVLATLLGMFETRVPIENLIDEKAPYKFRGFGHMGSAPGQILIKSLKEVSIEAPTSVRPK
jgi:hypothetical protein